jgi:peptidoglycan/LPS O-acetylase OafA/YrhL
MVQRRRRVADSAGDRDKPLRLLDSMRGMAMLSVFAAHAAGMLVAARHIHRDGDLTMAVLELARAGIALFFILSGFLLYLPFAYARMTGSPRPAAKRYYLRRGLRIIPAYWLALLVVGLWLYTPDLSPWRVTPDVLSWEGIVTYFGFLQVYRGETLNGGIAPAWAIDDFVLFYALLPLWAALMCKIPTSSVRSFLRTELLSLAVLVVASIGWKIFAFVLLSDLQAGWRPSAPVLYVLPAFLDYFAIGMGLAVFFLVVSTRRPVPRAVRVISRYPGAAWLAAAAVYCTFVAIDPWSKDGILTAADDPLLLLAHGLTGVAALGVLLPAVFGSPEQGLVRRLLGTRPLLWFGVVSYGFFLWHLPILFQLAHWGLLEQPLWYLASATVLSLGVGAASYYGLERPLLRLGRRLPRHAGQEEPARARPAHLLRASRAAALAGILAVVLLVSPVSRLFSSSDNQARLMKVGGRSVIVSSDRSIAIVPGAVRGHVDTISSVGKVLIVGGWAADTAGWRTADRVLVFADGRLLTEGRPNSHRPDLARAYSAALARSGFLVGGRTERARELADAGQVRVFAVVGRRASELIAQPRATELDSG